VRRGLCQQHLVVPLTADQCLLPWLLLGTAAFRYAQKYISKVLHMFQITSIINYNFDFMKYVQTIYHEPFVA
jgi:hypothetical protein